MDNPALILWGSGLIQLFSFSGMAGFLVVEGSQNQTLLLLLCLGISWIAYFKGVHCITKQTEKVLSLLPVIIFFGVAYRITMFLLPPLQADDFLRYLFDGRLILNGINPYNAIPHSFPELSGELIPKSDVKTIYPPLAELLFVISVSLKNSLWLWKSGILLADLGCILVLHQLILAFERSPSLILIYLWNPLILKELINSAHLEAWSLLCVLVFLLFWKQKKHGKALLAIVAASLIKIVPVVLAIPWLLSLPQKQRFKFFIVGMLIGICAFAVFYPYHPFNNLLLFFTSMHGVGIIYNALTFMFQTDTARILLTSSGAFMLHILIFKNKNLYQNNIFLTLELLLATCLFSSMGFPWYLVYAVPLLIFYNINWFMTFAALSQLSYYSLLIPEWRALALLMGAMALVLSLFVKHELFKEVLWKHSFKEKTV